MAKSGRPFKKGQKRHPDAGRKVGSVNKTTAMMKEVLELAITEMGGLQRLVDWARSSEHREDIFWSQMAMRLLPVQLQASGGGKELIVSIIDKDELTKRLEERGLPPLLFERDVPQDETEDAPLIELKANGSNGDAQ